jgi:hypothetical protein
MAKRGILTYGFPRSVPTIGTLPRTAIRNIYIGLAEDALIGLGEMTTRTLLIIASGENSERHRDETITNLTCNTSRVQRRGMVTNLVNLRWRIPKNLADMAHLMDNRSRIE